MNEHKKHKYHDKFINNGRVNKISGILSSKVSLIWNTFPGVDTDNKTTNEFPLNDFYHYCIKYGQIHITYLHLSLVGS